MSLLCVLIRTYGEDYEYKPPAITGSYQSELIGDKQSWTIRLGNHLEDRFYRKEEREKFLKLIKRLPFIALIDTTDPDAARRALLEHARDPDVYRRPVFVPHHEDSILAFRSFMPTWTRTDNEWEKSVAPTWLVDVPAGSNLRRIHDPEGDIIANSGFNGRKEVRWELLLPKKPLPAGVDVFIEQRDNRQDQMRDPDWFGARFNTLEGGVTAPRVTVVTYAGQRVFRWEAKGYGMQTTWPSQGRKVDCHGSSSIMDEVVPLVLAKHPSDLPADYRKFNPKQALVNQIEHQIPLLTAAINEPPLLLGHRYKPWAWVIGLGHLALGCRPVMTEADGPDWQDYVLPTADEYHQAQRELWEKHVWGPDPEEPLVDLDGYTKAVVAWRQQVLSVRLPKILARLKAGDIEYDEERKAWRFDD
jgi:hypothetical protein